jgi:hypothetical protein
MKLFLKPEINGLKTLWNLLLILKAFKYLKSRNKAQNLNKSSVKLFIKAVTSVVVADTTRSND